MAETTNEVIGLEEETPRRGFLSSSFKLLGSVTILGLAGNHFYNEWRKNQGKLEEGDKLKVCNLEALYLGVAQTPEEVPLYLRRGCETISADHEPDFERVLEALWETKIARNQGNARILSQARDKLLADYNENPRYMSLDEYLFEVQDVTAQTSRELNWVRAARAYGLDKRNAEILRDAMATVGGKELLAYGMTELFPSRDGNRNVMLLGRILERAGATFLESIPAMYDKFCSYGLFQFTSFAVNGATGAGASKMNRYLPNDSRIPGSMLALNGDEGHHTKAAFLFAAHNVALLLRNIDRKPTDEFARYVGNMSFDEDDVVQYIATAHHQPARARSAARKWLGERAERDFHFYTDGRIKGYTLKTKANYAALRRL